MNMRLCYLALTIFLTLSFIFLLLNFSNAMQWRVSPEGENTRIIMLDDEEVVTESREGSFMSGYVLATIGCLVGAFYFAKKYCKTKTD